MKINRTLRNGAGYWGFKKKREAFMVLRYDVGGFAQHKSSSRIDVVNPDYLGPRETSLTLYSSLQILPTSPTGVSNWSIVLPPIRRPFHSRIT